MKSILYLAAVLLLTTWLVGVLIYALGAVIHIVLVAALLVIVLLSRMEKKWSEQR
jgi:hypothetical protein